MTTCHGLWHFKQRLRDLIDISYLFLKKDRALFGTFRNSALFDFRLFPCGSLYHYGVSTIVKEDLRGKLRQTASRCQGSGRPGLSASTSGILQAHSSGPKASQEIHIGHEV